MTGLVSVRSRFVAVALKWVSERETCRESSYE